MTQTNKQDSIKVEIEVQEYGLWAFCKRIQECVLDGYRLDLCTNKNVPTAYGTMYVCVMLKDVVPQVEVLAPNAPEAPSEPEAPVVPAVTRTRQKKTASEDPGKA